MTEIPGYDWKSSRSTLLRLAEEEHRSRRPRVVENPDKALAWIKARKFGPSSDRWASEVRRCCLIDIAAMAIVAADAIELALAEETQP